MEPRKEYDFLVFIGRIQPLHDGHCKVIDEALSRAKTVIMLIGSANSSRSFRNPFTFEERARMVERVYQGETQQGQLIVAPIDDFPYNEQKWLAGVQRTVQDIALKHGNRNSPNVMLSGMQDFRIGLIGFCKDGTSYYLKRFPQWGSVNVDQKVVYNSTDIRKGYFRSAPSLPRDIAPEPVIDFMKQFMETSNFSELVNEYKFVKQYRSEWASAPYPAQFKTVDAVVIQSGHVLLVRRGQAPGKGLLALPGGFVGEYETCEQAVIRELKEETRISDHRGEIPPAKLKSMIIMNREFDDPYRDPRGRVFTQTYLLKLPEWDNLFEVRGDDDAEHASWYPIGTLDPREMFLDHYHVLVEMLEEA